MEFEDPEVVSLAEALEAEKHDVLSQVARNLDMRRRRVMDMRGNRRVLMPGTGPAVVEAEHTTKMDVWDKAFTRYRSANCDEEGTQLATNLSKNQA